jgi:hypothetical protein
MTHVAQQRRLTSSLPGEDSAHGRTLEAEAVAAERTPDLALATRSPSQPAAVEGPGPAPSPPAVGAADGAATRTSDGPSAPHGGPQRAPAGGGAGSGAGSRGHTHSEQELEVLAHLLYQRIGRHLRRELLVDRERAGLALDLP